MVVVCRNSRIRIVVGWLLSRYVGSSGLLGLAFVVVFGLTPYLRSSILYSVVRWCIVVVGLVVLKMVSFVIRTLVLVLM